MTFETIIAQYNAYLTSRSLSITNVQRELLQSVWDGLNVTESNTEPADVQLKIHQLKLENIGPYASLTVGFDETGVVALSGDIGAGKSTIFECIYFALTARTNKFGKTTIKNLKSQVHSGDASVQLLFELDGVSYVIQKMSTKEGAKLTWANQQISGIDNVDNKMSSLLPLSHDQLSYCLYLAQGDWDKMLMAAPKELRTMVVEKVLNLSIYSHIHHALNTQLAQAHDSQNQLVGRYEERSTTLERERLRFNGNEWVSGGIFQPRETHALGQIPGITNAIETLTTDVQSQIRHYLQTEQRLVEVIQQLQSQLTVPEGVSCSLAELDQVTTMVGELETTINTLAMLLHQRPHDSLSQYEKQQLYQWVNQVMAGQLTPEFIAEKLSEHASLLTQKDTIQAQKDILESVLIAKKSEVEESFVNASAAAEALKVVKTEHHTANVVLQQAEHQVTTVVQEIDKKQEELTVVIADLNQLNEDLANSQTSLLDQCIGFVQQHIHDQDLDTCPVCTSDISNAVSETEMNADNMQQHLQVMREQHQQQAVLNAKVQEVNQVIASHTQALPFLQQDVQKAEAVCHGLAQRLQASVELEQQTTLLADQMRNEIQEVQSEIANCDTELKTINEALMVLPSWIHLNSQTLKESISSLVSSHQQWVQLCHHNSTFEQLGLVYGPESIQTIQQFVQAQSELQADNLNDEALLAQQAELSRVTAEKMAFWRSFTTQHPAWQGRVNMDSMTQQQWKLLCQAVELQQQISSHAQAMHEASLELQAQQHHVALLTSMVSDFHNRGMCIQKYLANELFGVLCDAATENIQYFFGADAKVTFTGTRFNLCRGKLILPVNALSGGERFYVAIALAFAMRSFIQEKIGVTLGMLFIDEGFHMLKGVNVEKMMQVLEENAQAYSIWLITHNEQLVAEVNTICQVGNGAAMIMEAAVTEETDIL